MERDASKRKGFILTLSSTAAASLIAAMASKSAFSLSEIGSDPASIHSAISFDLFLCLPSTGGVARLRIGVIVGVGNKNLEINPS